MTTTAVPSGPEAVDVPATTKRSGHLGYQPALDGLRALAVIGVLLYHGGVDWMQGGFLGVDLFFTLSGFLITSLLLIEYRNNTSIDLRRFWTRRARRLLPALLVLLAGVCIYALRFADPSTLPRLRSDSLAALFYYGNWHFIYQGSSYFQQFQAPSPVLHVWSLAIEEQWYVIWPLVLIPMLRWSKGAAAKLLPVVIGLALLSAGWMAYLVGTDPNRVYLGTDTRAQSLLMGAAVSIIIVEFGTFRSLVTRRFLDVAAVCSLLGLFWLWYSVQESQLGIYKGGFLLHSFLVGIVITSVVQPGRAVTKFVLSPALLRGIGKISYGLYLYHFPIFQVFNFQRTGLTGFALLFVRTAVTTVVAVLSYYLIEMPIRKGAFKPRTMAVGTPVVVGLLVIAVFASTAGGTPTPGLAFSGGQQPLVAPGNAANGFEPKTMVIGDSVAFTLSETLFPEAASLKIQGEDQSLIGCGLTPDANVVIGGQTLPLYSGCRNLDQKWTDATTRIKPDVTVAMFSIWDELDQQINGQWYRFGTPKGDAYLSARFDDMINIVTAQGGKALLLTAQYTNRTEGADTGRKWESNDPKRVDHMNDLIRAAVARHKDVARVGELNKFLAPKGVYQERIDGQVWNRDGVHFNAFGGRLVSKWVAKQVHEIATPPPAASAPSVYLVGDSVAYDLGLGFPTLEKQGILTGNDGGRVGCGVDRDGKINQLGKVVSVIDVCGDWEPRWRQTVAQEKPEFVTILSGGWEMSDRQLGGKWYKYPSPEIDASLRKSWSAAIDAAGSAGARVVAFTFPYIHLAEATNGSEPVQNDPKRVDHLNAIIREVAKAKGADVIDLNSYLSPVHDKFETSLPNGVVVRDPDGVHFSDAGSVIISQWTVDQLNQLRKTPRPTPEAASKTGATTTSAASAH